MKTTPGPYPLIVTAAQLSTSSEFQFDGEAVCIPMVSSTGHGHASLKRVHYASGRFAVANIIAAVQLRDASSNSTKFLALHLQHFKDELIVTRMRGTANVSLSITDLKTIPVNLPPLAEQQRIVDLIESLDEAIKAADELVRDAAHAFRSLLRVKTAPTPTSVPLTEVCQNLDNRRIPVSALIRQGRPGNVPYYGAAGQTGWIDEPIFDETLVCLGEDGNGLLRWAEVPIAYKIDGPSWVNNHAHVLRPTGVSADWLLLSLMHYDISELLNEGTRPKLNKGVLDRIMVRRDTGVLQDERLLSVLLDAARAAEVTQDSLRTLRSELLTVLLSGEHEIPESYDAFLRPASQLEPAA